MAPSRDRLAIRSVSPRNKLTAFVAYLLGVTSSPTAQGRQRCKRGYVYEDFERCDANFLWELRIPVADGRHVNFFHDLEPGASSVILTAFATAVEHGVKACLARSQDGAEVIKMPPIMKHYAAAATAPIGGR